MELKVTEQAILAEQRFPPQIWCVLDESVLRRAVGGPEVMRAQLLRLIELTELANVEIQVLPDEAGAHAADEGTFMILDYPAEFAPDPGTVYVQTRQQGIYYDSRRRWPTTATSSSACRCRPNGPRHPPY